MQTIHRLVRCALPNGHCAERRKPFRVRVEPDTAQISLDDEPVERDADGTITLNLGTYTIRATAPGHLPMQRKIRVNDNRAQTIEMQLSPVSAAVAATADAGNGRPAALEPGMAVETRDGDATEEGDAIYDSWLFWTIVGVVAAGSVTGVVLATRGGSVADPMATGGSSGITVTIP